MKLAGTLLFALSLGAQTLEPMRIDLQFLCSGALAGRLSLDRGADVAAQYIAANFRKAGLKTQLQAFPLIAYQSNRAASSVVLHQGEKTERLQWRGGFPHDIALRAPIVFAGYGITAPEYKYDDYAGIDVKGKAVLMFDHEPQEDNPASIFNGTGFTIHANRARKIINAQSHGAMAVLILSEPLRTHLGVFDPPATTANGNDPRRTAPGQALAQDHTEIPAVTLTDAAGALLLGDAKRMQQQIDASLQPASKPLNAEIDIRLVNKQTERGTSYNVLGLLPGSDAKLSSETIILSAHYDHLGVDDSGIYRGANDNASGTVAVMELARVFTARKPPPKRSILFIVFGSEEEGLLGSYYYVEHPTRALAATRAVINLDMIARDEAHIPQSKGALEIPSDTSRLINLVGVYNYPVFGAALSAAATQAGLTVSRKFDRDHYMNALFRCDHFPFLLKGVPAAWIFGGFHPGYHETSDTIENLNFDKLLRATRMAGFAAARIANAP